MTHSLHDISTFAVDLALLAGELMEKEQRNAQYESSFKNHQELVTSVDLKVDELIHKRIRANYPDHAILSEENMSDISKVGDLNGPLWVIDPIDGTVNFAHGHYQVAVSIAYFEGGEAKIGVVHCPFQNETFHAMRGQYSLRNHKPIQVSGATNLRQALVATGFPYDKSRLPELIQRLQAVMMECQDIRRIGSAALDICWVAMGRLDAYYETVSPWDCAAARLIAQEAGASCGNLTVAPEGMPEELNSKDLLIASPALYQPLADILLKTL
ncbi:inositol monophosphatase [Hahella sp. KA22]|uniref:inositol monophosphatase family protein n=1 Tax=Hahella sp. KA22 TaxID=1628392 RepID=UPI000FDDA120|nr:inositol monophosphatase family protein [Hahella sp. KA22]AZZ94507.1 inositol monophosphatase [Hahella sp. KA22]QAY57880.1 inositol monophosphatase [Hahella sp. KA22]